MGISHKVVRLSFSVTALLLLLLLSLLSESLLVFFYYYYYYYYSQGKLPEFYRRYVDDTLVKMPDLVAATVFLDTLNHAHSAVSFTMEIEENGMLPFLGVQLLIAHHVLKQRFTLNRRTQGYSCTTIAMWTAATNMVYSSPCLITRIGYHHLGRISQKSVNA